MTKTCLVIGGGGFIGRHLIQQLSQRGYSLCVLDIIPRPANISEDIKWLTGSILTPEDLDAAMDGMQIVFHLAALAHLGVPQTQRYEQINTDGTQAVIDAAAKHNVEHLLITSTEVILRDWRVAYDAPLTAHDALPDMAAMAGPYCRSKLKAETAARVAMTAGQPISLLYPTVPIGPGDYNLTAPTAMLRQFLKAPPPAYLDCRLNLVAVEDVAKAHVLAAEHPAGKLYMLGGEDVDMSTLLDWLAPLTDKTLPKRTVPYGLAALTAHVSQLGAKVTAKAPLASVEGVRLARRKVNVDS
ncbi:MAG: NAD-dependent epimerase/dehydratase family protein, partial [Marinomonas sp.]